MTMNWDTLHVPLAAGPDTKADPRALRLPRMAVAENAVFREIGGIQKRPGFEAFPTTIAGGGTLADIRALATAGDELLLFTKRSLYSWSEALSAWQLKGDYPAPKVSEKIELAITTSEQEFGEIGQIGDVILYAWEDSRSGTVNISAIDATTGTTILEESEQKQDGTWALVRPRIVPLVNKFLLFAVMAFNSNLYVKAIDPTDLAAGASASWTLVDTTLNKAYDVEAIPGTTTAVVAFESNLVTSYKVAKIDESLVITSATKARRADAGHIAVAISMEASLITVIRVDANFGSVILGDHLNLADMSDTAHVGVQIGFLNTAGTSRRLTAAYRTTQDGGAYRCYVFATRDETDTSGGGKTEYGHLDSAGTASGTLSDFRMSMWIVSRAFKYDGDVYLFLGFSGASDISMTAANDVSKVAFQNSYFLVRHDNLLVARVMPHLAEGRLSKTSYVPGVQAVSATRFLWAPSKRRIVAVTEEGDEDAYEAKRLVRVTLDFDSDEARRVVDLGATSYLPGGQVSQYDGRSVAEVGFHVMPWHFDPTITGTSGNVDVGKHSYKALYMHENARGEVERSSVAAVAEADVTSLRKVNVAVHQLHATAKKQLAVEVYRTEKDPGPGAAFHLITSKDPSDTGNNGYMANDTSVHRQTLGDNLSDADLITKALFPLAAGEQDPVAPPPGTFLAAGQGRLWLTGIPGEPNQVWFSRLRFPGEIVSFADTFTLEVPQEGGPVTAVAPLDQAVVIFKRDRIYMIQGSGPNNLGQGAYTEPQLISSDAGCSEPRSVVQIQAGLMFRSRKGIYLLDRGFSVAYIGAPVEDYVNDQTIVAAHLMEEAHQVRFLCSSGRSLVFDYAVQQWSTWTITGLSAVIWQGKYLYAASSTALRREDTSYQDAGVAYSCIVETPWIPIGEIQNFGRARRWFILGESRSTHNLRVRVAYDYEISGDEPLWVDDDTWTPVTTGAGGYQVRGRFSRQRCEAVKFRIEDVDQGGTVRAEASALTALKIELGFKRGGMRLAPEKTV